MKNLTLKNIAECCGGRLENCKDSGVEVTSVVSDSREVEKGSLFLAIKGERVDGHKFIPQTFEMGAAAVLCEDAPDQAAGPYILVENVLLALQEIAKFYREGLSIPIVGITGSVGKTSTKESIAAVLSQKYRVLKTAGNYNNEIGVPLTLLRIREEHEVAVIEMGINHFGEMHRLSRMAQPTIAVMTNIGQCHLEFLGSRDGILKAKSEIFDYMNENGRVIVNGDDDKLCQVTSVHGRSTIQFGKAGSTDVYADQIQGKGLWGTDAVIHGLGEPFDIHIPLPGQHMVYNAMAAAVVGNTLGLSAKEIQDGIAGMTATAGRSNLIRGKKQTLIDDCYNANPVSMKAAIDLLMLAEGRKVALLGDMFELGEKENQMHAEVGAYAAQKGVDQLICVGTMSKYMADAAKENGAACVLHFETLDQLTEELENLLIDDDTVLIKASHGMHFEKVVSLLQ